MKYFAPITHECYYVILNLNTSLLERDFQGDILGVLQADFTGIDTTKYLLIQIKQIHFPENWSMIADEDRRELFGDLIRVNDDSLQELRTTIEKLEESLENARRY